MEDIWTGGRVTSGDRSAAVQQAADERAEHPAHERPEDHGLRENRVGGAVGTKSRRGEHPAGPEADRRCESTSHAQIVEASTGNVDPDGDVVGSLIERLRAQVGPDVSAEIDPDTQARLAAGLLLTAPLRQVK